MQNNYLTQKLDNEASRIRMQLEEIRASNKKRQEEALEKERIRLEEERENVRLELLRHINKCSLNKLANYTTSKYSGYKPHLLDFETLLERIHSNKNIDLDEESLKIKLDLIEQISKMKNLPSSDTICHIESNKWQNSSRFRYRLLKLFFRNNKYRIVFHNKKVKLEDEVYELRFREEAVDFNIFILMFGLFTLVFTIVFETSILPAIIIFVLDFLVWVIWR